MGTYDFLNTRAGTTTTTRAKIPNYTEYKAKLTVRDFTSKELPPVDDDVTM